MIFHMEGDLMKKNVLLLLLFLILLNGNMVHASQTSFRIEMLEWKVVNTLLPKYSKFTVLDIESGKQFNVQRRAGSHHSDVQPLTAKDTKIMKRIYSGKWSWKRRAVLIITKDRMIAASMHGMPHGAGALDNNFPGHFCIHFYGSTTHSTNTMDLSHMLMIYKASGKLEEYLVKANPYEIISAYVAGLKQHDKVITSLISLQEIKWAPIFAQIENVRITRMPLLPAEDLNEEISIDIPIEIDWFIKDRGRQSFKGVIHAVRFSTVDAWKVDSLSFIEENRLH
jgi:hypothetical protein